MSEDRTGAAGTVRDRWMRALLPPLTILAWLAVILVLGWLLSHVTRALLILVLSALVAFALTPLVDLLARFMPRTLATALAYVLGFGLVGAFLTYVVTTAAGQVANLAHNLPLYAHQAQGLETQIERLLAPWGVTRGQIASTESRLVAYLQQTAGSVAGQTFELLQGFFNAVIDAVLILILSVYLVANGPRLNRWLREQAPTGQRRRASMLIAIVNQVVGGYVRGTLAMATLVGVLVGVGMALLHVRYALLLGVLAFFMEFVPVLGVIISGAVCVLVALFQGWVTALLVLAYFVLVHVVEGDLAGPRIMGRAVGIHPAVALLALAAGTELFGLWGALFGAPIAGLLQAIVTAVWRELQATRVLEGPGGIEVARASRVAGAEAEPRQPSLLGRWLLGLLHRVRHRD
ncbi:MAG TPA: AI-2E family transporter [Candidatus Dormibacteraeota bacterium]|nr:AI-2E family transporter [Candidatus Dormibacteraeota bacterium]